MYFVYLPSYPPSLFLVLLPRLFDGTSPLKFGT
ncbi:MAG: hypothetical protein BECKG1743D_GA0114223_109584, partial [Candidatus Kentron sp. G]